MADSTQNNYLAKLDQLGLIGVSGDERVSYLQGQVSIDMEKLDRHHGKLGAHCDFKGKAWNIFYAFDTTHSIQLLSHKAAIPAALAELKKYGVFAKVDISDVSDNWRIMGGTGSKIETLINQHFGDIPFEHEQVFSHQKGLVMALKQPCERYLLVLTPDLANKFISEFGQDLDSAEQWEAYDIQAGLPLVQGETANEYVPQMLNVQALGGIDFEKGCYMGQEVVARTKYLGKNKRAAFVLQSDGEYKAASGEVLESQVGENWRRSGIVLRSASVGGQTWILAVLANDTQQGTHLRLKAQPDAILTVQAMPYDLS